MSDLNILRLGILLIDGFGLLAYTSIIEPFRAANMFAEAELYRWLHISMRGAPMQASNGASILPDATVGDDIEIDTLFVIGGRDQASFNDTKTFAWLRRLARAGVRLAGVSSGPFILAKAGLLENHRCTIHWDYVPAFLETFPTLMLEHSLYVIDRKRITCAGGSAGLDLSLDLIEREHGHALAVAVSEWFVRTKPRSPDEKQRMSLRERYDVSSDRLLKVLAHMEATVEEPEDREALNRIAGLSSRQLERLFKAQLGTTVGETYRRIRLDHAHDLLRKTGMSVTEVAIASGFVSSSHFSRAFKARYGHPPSSER